MSGTFVIKHPDGRYWSVDDNYQVKLGDVPALYELHDGNHIKNTATEMCIRHSYWVLVESHHDNVPGDFEWTINEDGKITSSFDGGHDVVVDGDSIKIANDGSTVYWKIIYKNNRFCMCPNIEKCTCNNPTVPIFTEPPETLVPGRVDALDVLTPEAQKIIPLEIIQKLVPPEFITPEILEKLSVTPPEPAPEAPLETPTESEN
jgi:hypothetical protein